MSPESSRLMHDLSVGRSRWSEGLSSSASRKRRGWVAELWRPGGAFGQLEYPTPPFFRRNRGVSRQAVRRATPAAVTIRRRVAEAASIWIAFLPTGLSESPVVLSHEARLAVARPQPGLRLANPLASQRIPARCRRRDDVSGELSTGPRRGAEIGCVSSPRARR